MENCSTSSICAFLLIAIFFPGDAKMQCLYPYFLHKQEISKMRREVVYTPVFCTSICLSISNLMPAPNWVFKESFYRLASVLAKICLSPFCLSVFSFSLPLSHDHFPMGCSYPISHIMCAFFYLSIRPNLDGLSCPRIFLCMLNYCIRRFLLESLEISYAFPSPTFNPYQFTC